MSADHSAANDLNTHLHTNTHSHMHDIVGWEPQPRVRGSWRKMEQNRKGEIFRDRDRGRRGIVRAAKCFPMCTWGSC